MVLAYLENGIVVMVILKNPGMKFSSVGTCFANKYSKLCFLMEIRYKKNTKQMTRIVFKITNHSIQLISSNILLWHCEKIKFPWFLIKLLIYLVFLNKYFSFYLPTYRRHTYLQYCYELPSCYVTHLKYTGHKIWELNKYFWL